MQRTHASRRRAGHKPGARGTSKDALTALAKSGGNQALLKAIKQGKPRFRPQAPVLGRSVIAREGQDGSTGDYGGPGWDAEQDPEGWEDDGQPLNEGDVPEDGEWVEPDSWEEPDYPYEDQFPERLDDEKDDSRDPTGLQEGLEGLEGLAGVGELLGLGAGVGLGLPALAGGLLGGVFAIAGEGTANAGEDEMVAQDKQWEAQQRAQKAQPAAGGIPLS